MREEGPRPEAAWHSRHRHGGGIVSPLGPVSALFQEQRVQLEARRSLDQLAHPLARASPCLLCRQTAAWAAVCRLLSIPEMNRKIDHCRLQWQQACGSKCAVAGRRAAGGSSMVLPLCICNSTTLM